MRYEKIVNKWIKQGAKATAIYNRLIKRGADPAVAREWSREPQKRFERNLRRIQREGRGQLSGAPRQANRRIISSGETILGRTRYLHATKGWRSYPEET